MATKILSGEILNRKVTGLRIEADRLFKSIGNKKVSELTIEEVKEYCKALSKVFQAKTELAEYILAKELDIRLFTEV